MDPPQADDYEFLDTHGDALAGVVRQLCRDLAVWPLPDWDWAIIAELAWLLADGGQFSGRELLALCLRELLP